MNKQRGFTLKKYIAKTISKELISLSILFFILCISFASADILEGGIFDYELNSLENVTVEIKNIETGLLQIIESNNGIYRFQLETGEYQLHAFNNDFSTTEDLIIKGGGKHIYDLFLYPNWEKEDLIWERINNLDSSDYQSEKSTEDSFISSFLNENGSERNFYDNLLFIVLALLTFLIIKKHFSKNRKNIRISFNKKKNKDKKEVIQSKSEVNTPESVLNGKPIIEEDFIDKEILNEIGSEDKVNSLAKVSEKELVIPAMVEPVKKKRGRPKKSETPKIDKDEISEKQEDNPKYIEQMIRIIRANGGKITQNKLISEMSHISEEKVKAVLNGLEFQEQVITSKRGKGKNISLK